MAEIIQRPSPDIDPQTGHAFITYITPQWFEETIARYAIDQGMGFTIKDTEQSNATPQLYGSLEARSYLLQVKETPELRALIDAELGSGTPEGQVPPDVLQCSWDDDTKTRVTARYWENLAHRYQRIVDLEAQTGYQHDYIGRNLGYPVQEEYQHIYTNLVQFANQQVQETLGSLQPATREDMHVLARETAAQVLHQPR